MWLNAGISCVSYCMFYQIREYSCVLRVAHANFLIRRTAEHRMALSEKAGDVYCLNWWADWIYGTDLCTRG